MPKNVSRVILILLIDYCVLRMSKNISTVILVLLIDYCIE